jgi:hypothetical protein
VVLLHVVLCEAPKTDTGTIDPSVDYARLRLEEYAGSIDWEGCCPFAPGSRRISGGDISDVVNRVTQKNARRLS